MKNILFFLSIFVFAASTYAQKNIINLNQAETFFKVTSLESTNFECINSISNISFFDVITDSDVFTQLQINGYSKDYTEIGNPSVLAIKKLVEIPEGANISIDIISYNVEEIKLSDFFIYNKLIPVQPSVSKSEDPENARFYYNRNNYKVNGFSSKPLAELIKVGKMRGTNIGRLELNPIQYNPVTKTISVYNNLEIKVIFKDANIVKTNKLKQKYYSPYFTPSFVNTTNYKAVKDTLVNYGPVTYVIVSDPMFESTLQPFVKWKTQKGFNVIEAYTNDTAVGTSTTSIKAYLQNLYNNATPTNTAPSFVLFVGDIAQIPAFSGTTGGHITDLYYCEYDGGGDVLPELYYGRFSATNIAELLPQIDKTIEYEKYLFPDPSFLNRVVMVAGVDGSYAPTYGNGQINYGTNNYFNASHGLISNTYLYGSGSPILSNDAVASDSIQANISNGVGFVNYTAHCGPSGWANPSFTIADVADLQNEDKYPLSIGNCCQSNQFNNSVCFGEALLRANNKGAIGHIGGSNSTLWDEDYYWGVGVATVSANPTYAASSLGAYDGVFHDHGEAESKWYVTNGQVMFRGNLAVTEGGTNYINYYWEIYHLMGDPSVMTYFSVPQALSVSHATAMPIGISSLTVTTEPGAYIALSLNDTILLDAQLSDTSGIVNFNFTAINQPLFLDIVGTKQNRAPYLGTIQLIVGSVPYISYTSNNVNDAAGNNNGIADYNESIILDVTLSNIGSVATDIDSVLISTTDTNIVITDNFNAWGVITYSGSVQQIGAFAFDVNNYIVDQHSVSFNGIVKDINDSIWNINFSINLNAPILDIQTIIIDDTQYGNGNNRLDPGEIATLYIPTKNIGHADSPFATGTLSSSNPYISITQSSQMLNIIMVDSIEMAQFEITVDAAISTGNSVIFNYNVDASPYSSSKTITLAVGMLVEDWETNNFTKYLWNNTSSTPWYIISGTEAYEGNYAARSGNINDNQNSDLQIDINVLANDSISFFQRVSSEGNMYDYLEFVVDGTTKGQWSGLNSSYSREAYAITSGNHNLLWSYTKDMSVSNGDDAAWVDFIVFPPADNILITRDNVIDNSLNFTIYPNPANDYTEINLNGDNSSFNLSIYNSLGEEIKSIKVNNNTINLNLSEFNSGVYYCKLTVNETTFTKKIVIKH